MRLLSEPRPGRMPHYARSRSWSAATAVLAVVAFGLVACGEEETPEGPAPAASAGSAYDLAGVCPETVVIQTDWNPESEHGGTYQLVGPNPTIDTDAKSVTGPLVAAGGVDTGVDIEIRAGGPAIGFQSVTAQLYQDTDITLGYGATDEAIALSIDQPTIGVFAGLEKSPQIIMWDPEVHPDWETIADIGETDTKVLYFSGAVYMDYFTGAGILQASQVDGSYDGLPIHYVGSNGEFAQQGFATAEPYIYEFEVQNWMKPVKYELIADAGFDFYQQMLTIRAGDLETLRPCLEKLVPILQQASVDFLTDPTETNELIVELVEEYDNGWIYSAGVAEYCVETMLELGIMGNGIDATIGNFEESRVQALIDKAVPIYESQNHPVKPDITPADIMTNEFIDESIGLS
jgi:hypothetical protein